MSGEIIEPIHYLPFEGGEKRLLMSRQAGDEIEKEVRRFEVVYHDLTFLRACLYAVRARAGREFVREGLQFAVAACHEIYVANKWKLMSGSP